MRLQKVSDLKVLVNLGEVWKSSSLLEKEKEIEQDKTKEENGNKRIKKLLEKEKAVKRKKKGENEAKAPFACSPPPENLPSVFSSPLPRHTSASLPAACVLCLVCVVCLVCSVSSVYFTRKIMILQHAVGCMQ